MDRTRGELSARCDSEAHNLLALNLANDVISGNKSVEDARAAYAQMAMAEKEGQLSAYLQKLQFLSPTGGSADQTSRLCR